MEGEARILCVDDEVNVLNSIRRLFIDEDYEILSATSGEEGLAILREVSPVQLVIADYRMPGMNGVAFLKDVCALWPETVRIILSGYADTVSIVSAINEGKIYKFIPKPWNDDELKMTVAGALGQDSLHKRNSELAGELRRSNDKLKALSESFERRVEEKISDLMARNNMLSSAQNILDSLPVAVIGIDADGLIVLCNRKASELFPGKRGIVPGMDHGAALPASVNNLIDKAGRHGGLSEAITLDGGKVHIKSAGVTFPDERGGLVLVFDQDD